jgi:hypothetical protein
MIIQDIHIDIKALLALSHTCRPERCDRRLSCCATYEVPLERGESSRVLGLLPDAARYAKKLREQGDFVDPLDEGEMGPCLATDESGKCMFAYTKQGATLCSLHSAALDLNMPPYRMKPRACSLWPLAITDDDPQVLGVQPGALSFPCNARRRKGAKRLHPGVADTIREVLGSAFLAELEDAISAGV